MTIALQKVQAATAAEVCARFELGEEAAPLLEPGMTPGAFLARLIEEQQFPDALQLLAFGLPPREAVWWACVCTRSELGPETPPVAVKALQAAEAWSFRPDEERRRTAEAAADASELEHPAGWAALAAFWSGGSLVRPDLQAVEPTPDLTPKAVYASVSLAGYLKDPGAADARFEEYVQRGIDLANGGSGRLEGEA